MNTRSSGYDVPSPKIWVESRTSIHAETASDHPWTFCQSPGPSTSFSSSPIAPESLQLGVYWWFLFFPKERSPEHNSLNLSPSILRSQTKPKRKMKHTVERKWWFVRNSWGKLGRGSASTDLKAQEKFKVFYVPTTLLIWFITQKELSDGKKDTMLSLNFK